MVDEPKGTPPAMFYHCQKVYAEMLKTAEAIPNESLEGPDILVYRGFTTKLFSGLGIAIPYYGKVLSILEDMGCISQLRRGGGTSPSEWALWKEPELAPFTTSLGVIAPSRNSTRLDRVETQYQELVTAIGGLDIPRALYDLGRRLDTLEARLDSKDKEKTDA